MGFGRLLKKYWNKIRSRSKPEKTEGAWTFRRGRDYSGVRNLGMYVVAGAVTLSGAWNNFYDNKPKLVQDKSESNRVYENCNGFDIDSLRAEVFRDDSVQDETFSQVVDDSKESLKGESYFVEPVEQKKFEKKEASLRADVLDKSGTINSGDNIHTILYDVDKGGIKVPEGDYFVKLGSDFYNSENGLICIPEDSLEEGSYLRFGSKSLNESFRGKIGFVGGEEKGFEKVHKKKQEKTKKKSLESSFDSEEGDFGSELERVLGKTNFGLSDLQLKEKFASVSDDVLDLFNKGKSAYGITDTYALSTQGVYDTIAERLDGGRKYVAQNITKDGLVYFNQRLLDSLKVETDSGKVSFEDHAYDLYWNRGLSLKEVQMELEKYTADFESEGRAMNFTKDRIKKWAGVFSEKYFYENKDEILKDFGDRKIKVLYDKGKMKVTGRADSFFE